MPLRVSPGESLQEHHSPIYATTNLRYNLTTVRPTTSPGHLQEHYPNFLKSVAAQDGLRYYRHDLLCSATVQTVLVFPRPTSMLTTYLNHVEIIHDKVTFWRSIHRDTG